MRSAAVNVSGKETCATGGRATDKAHTITESAPSGLGRRTSDGAELFFWRGSTQGLVQARDKLGIWCDGQIVEVRGSSRS